MAEINSYAPSGNTPDPYQYAQPGSRASAAVVKAVLPGLYNYFTQDAPPPQITPNAAGKVPPADYNPNTLPAMQDLANIGMAAIPGGALESLVPRGAGAVASYAPEVAQAARRLYGIAGDTAAATSPASIAAAPAAAGDTRPTLPDRGPRPSATAEEQAGLQQLQQQIAAANAARAKAMGKPGSIGPKAAALQAAPYDTQIAQENDQIKKINDQVAARQNAYDAQAATDQSDYGKALKDYETETAPFALRHPTGNEALAAAPAASAASGSILGGLAGGKIGPVKRAMTYGAAGLGGALEGLIGGYYPTYADQRMPEGSAAKDQAIKNQADPSYWLNTVAPEVGMSAGTAMLGAKFGMLRPGAAKYAPNVASEAAALPAAVGKSAPAEGTVAKVFHSYRGPDGRFAKRPPSSPSSP